MTEKILLVDDEPAVLSGYQRTLYKDFSVDTAVGGEAGLMILENQGPYAVVVSDMRMPGMNGAQFLAAVRDRSPDSTRMLLTGFTELDPAIEAINKGNIFRFLTKPCDKETLTAALNAGIEQNRLLRAEKDLLEQTLIKSIGVLADVLAVASPKAFGKSRRITHVVKHISMRVKLTRGWWLEAAATLCHLGCIALEQELIHDALLGSKLDPELRRSFEEHPRAAMRLLENIPRMEPVAWVIGQQLLVTQQEPPAAVPTELHEELRLCASILKLALDFDRLRAQGLTAEAAEQRMQCSAANYGRHLVDALQGLRDEAGQYVPQRLAVQRLTPGMLLDEEVRNRQGLLVLPKGQEITAALLMRIENFVQSGVITGTLAVMVPA